MRLRKVVLDWRAILTSWVMFPHPNPSQGTTALCLKASMLILDTYMATAPHSVERTHPPASHAGSPTHRLEVNGLWVASKTTIQTMHHPTKRSQAFWNGCSGKLHSVFCFNWNISDATPTFFVSIIEDNIYRIKVSPKRTVKLKTSSLVPLYTKSFATSDILP